MSALEARGPMTVNRASAVANGSSTSAVSIRIGEFRAGTADRAGRRAVERTAHHAEDVGDDEAAAMHEVHDVVHFGAALQAGDGTGLDDDSIHALEQPVMPSSTISSAPWTSILQSDGRSMSSISRSRRRWARGRGAAPRARSYPRAGSRPGCQGGSRSRPRRRGRPAPPDGSWQFNCRSSRRMCAATRSRIDQVIEGAGEGVVELERPVGDADIEHHVGPKAIAVEQPKGLAPRRRRRRGAEGEGMCRRSRSFR